MAGVPSSYVKALVLKALSDSTDVWVATDIGKIGDLGIARIGTLKIGRHEASIHIHGKKRETMSKRRWIDEMVSAGVGMSLHSSKTVPIQHLYQETGRAMETNLLIEAGGGGRRIATKSLEIEER